MAEIQLRNGKVTRTEMRARHPDDFRAEVDEAVHLVIRTTVRAVKNSNGCRLVSFPLSDDTAYGHHQPTFLLSFANRLIKALGKIVGRIYDGEDDTILMFLFQELADIGARREIVEDNYVFAYQNNEYMVNLHTA
ncbi:MAG: hypothetical protein PHD99_02790 [Candidatus Moranbacteria bacterium]|nr:hypothetical protein [Candidatus Moranbacteria bacterium]